MLESIKYEYHNAGNLDFEPVTDIELAWLAGIIDGEGSISAGVTFRKTGNIIIVPYILITNTDEEIINNVIEILDKMKMGFKVSWIKDNINKHHKLRCNLRIDRYSRVRHLAKCLLPYLFGKKKENAKVVLEFMDEREATLFTRGPKGKIVRNKYTVDQVTKIASIRVHAKAAPLEKMLLAPNVA